jgi:hypothetical protein
MLAEAEVKVLVHAAYLHLAACTSTLQLRTLLCAIAPEATPRHIIHLK